MDRTEDSIGLNYLDYLISLPKNRFSEDHLYLKGSEPLLKSKPYGLQHVKERGLDYLADGTLCRYQVSRVMGVDEEITRNHLEYILRNGRRKSTTANGLEVSARINSEDCGLVLRSR